MDNIIKFPTRMEWFIKKYSLRESTDDDLLDFGLTFTDIDNLINDGYLEYSVLFDVYILLK